MLQFVDRILTIAAAMSYGSYMFHRPQDNREEAGAKGKQLYTPRGANKSDHMAIVAALAS